ncbi:MAG TPA: UDP-N-acetylmuramoyl-L-alanine--D-glutamate ligase [Acidimicrobiales bacterium]
MSGDHHLVVGFGVTGRAVARALLAHGDAVTVVDDRPSADVRAAAQDLGVELIEAPGEPRLRRLVEAACAVVPAPGLPARHPLFSLARRSGVPILSEFDLAARWDDRPLVAVTGTDGKTTVVTLVCEMLQASGRRALAVGNTEVPLVAAIEDPTFEVFVVEASSFRLEHSQHFAPEVAAWLNFAPDHLDSHPDLVAYEAAKARIWAEQAADQVAVGNADDPVVARHLAGAPGRRVSFSAGGDADFRVAGRGQGRGRLVGPGGVELCEVGELPRAFPHDVANGLAAAATAMAGGASAGGVREALLSFRGLRHRVELVGEAGGVRYYDDSKATTPHAAAAAVAGFESVVLICGGRNKGLDLGALAEAAGSVRAVVAIGEAAGEVEAAFAGVRPVRRAASMDDAVRESAALASPGDAVLLAPGCASFDWYGSYGERGDDFARAARDLVGAT